MYFSYCPTKKIYGKNSIHALEREIRSTTQIAIIASNSAINNSEITFDLNTTWNRAVFKKIYSNAGEPTYEQAALLANELAWNNVQVIVCIGGGSIIDLSKAAALMAQFDGTAFEKWEKLKGSSFDIPSISLYVVSTVPGTSSESNSVCVITDPTGYKCAISKASSFPVCMAFDPSHSRSLPLQQIHRGLFDAYVHVLEQCIRDDVVCIINDNLCVAAITTILDLHHRLLNAAFTDEDLVRFSRISSFIIDSSTLGRGVVVDAVTHELATFLSGHFPMSHSTTLACVLPDYLAHSSNTGKRGRFDYLMERATSSVNAFYNRNVLLPFDLHRFIAESSIVESHYERQSIDSIDRSIRLFLDERDKFWKQKCISKSDAEEVLRKVLRTLNA